MKPRAIVLAVVCATALAADQVTEPAFVNSIGMPFVLIPAGKFVMGTPPGEWGRGRNEGPAREVTITRPFYVCQYETVNKWFEQFLDETKYDASKAGESDFQARRFPLKPSPKPGRVEHLPDYPIIFVSWYASLRFCNWLSQKEGRTPAYVFEEGKTEGQFGLPLVTMKHPHAGGYRLPTEAEWEYAARAGTKSAFFFGPDATDFAKYSYVERYGRPMVPRALPPKGIRPNPWGLYHMVGNVGEWCWDRYSASYEFYKTVDPTGPQRGKYRVNRDGAGMGAGGNAPMYGRSGTRMMDLPSVTRYNLGFRVVLCKVD